MTVAAYLRQHRPARSQYRSPRRSRPTGLTVVHTAESVMDSVGPDTGAENVARFIQERSEAGSYHDLADSDSALQLVEYTDEAYQDGTGSNPIAMSISFALRTSDWRKLSASRRAAFLRQGAKAFARQQAWLRARGYPTTPLRRISRAASERGEAGFISHAERDPSRRTDPGSDFPWDEWFDACRAAISGTNEEEDMSAEDIVRELLGTKLGRSGPTVAVALQRAGGGPWGINMGTNPADGKTPIDAGNALRIASNYAFKSFMEAVAQRSRDAALLEAINAVQKGEKFDVEKLLDDIEERTRAGMAQGILDGGEALRALATEPVAEDELPEEADRG